MSLFSFWKKRKAEPSPASPVPDVWEVYKGHWYVAGLKKRYDEIVKRLSRPDRIVTVDLDLERRCAWFRTSGGWAIAKVIVHGECGSPYKAIVCTLLPWDECEVFRQLLRLSIVEIRDPDW